MVAQLLNTDTTHRFMMTRIWIPLSLLFALSVTGCESLRFYTQAAAGQMFLLSKRKPIETLLSDPKTSPDLRRQLTMVADIRAFARDHLFLPLNGSYLSYADLGRPYAVWNVYASPEFSLQPKTWCHPFAGCVAYQGYFSESSAITYAKTLRAKGYDTFVSGVAAYSTLGWFNDPVLNTYIHRPDRKLAALVFHELSHQLLYVKDDTAFNESFAAFVEQEGLRRWLAHTGDPAVFGDYREERRRHQDFVRFVGRYRKRLVRLYAQASSLGEKRHAKAEIFSQMKQAYTRLKRQWGGYRGYDRWFQTGLNNAKIMTVSTYHKYVPAFSGLLAGANGDLKVFYRKCRNLAKLDREQRHELLERFATHNVTRHTVTRVSSELE